MLARTTPFPRRYRPICTPFLKNPYHFGDIRKHHRQQTPYSDLRRTIRESKPRVFGQGDPAATFLGLVVETRGPVGSPETGKTVKAAPPSLCRAA